MTSKALPSTRPAISSASTRLTPSEISSLREHKKAVAAAVPALLDKVRAEKAAQADAAREAAQAQAAPAPKVAAAE